MEQVAGGPAINTVTNNHLRFYLPSARGPLLLPLSSVLGSRKHRNLVLGVVQRHEPSLVLERLTNGFVSVLVQDVPVLQDPWDSRWSPVKQKLVTA